MNKELEKSLVAAFPSFFRDYGGDPIDTCMAWGCEHGDGWYCLLYDLCTDIGRECEKDPELLENFKFLQIKEKFGALRIYCNNANDAIYKLIGDAEADSLKTCELCGSGHHVTTGGSTWIQTLCGSCRKPAATKNCVQISGSEQPLE